MKEFENQVAIVTGTTRDRSGDRKAPRRRRMQRGSVWHRVVSQP